MSHRKFDCGERVVERWNRVFRAVSAEPRRQLVVSLLDAPPDRSVPLPESSVNPNVPVDRQRLEIELRHTHLPKLAEMGFVEWETEPLVAARGPQFEEVAVVFEALHAHAGEIPTQLLEGCRRLERERG